MTSLPRCHFVLNIIIIAFRWWRDDKDLQTFHSRGRYYTNDSYSFISPLVESAFCPANRTFLCNDPNKNLASSLLPLSIYISLWRSFSYGAPCTVSLVAYLPRGSSYTSSRTDGRFYSNFLCNLLALEGIWMEQSS